MTGHRYLETSLHGVMEGTYELGDTPAPVVFPSGELAATNAVRWGWVVGVLQVIEIPVDRLCSGQGLQHFG